MSGIFSSLSASSYALQTHSRSVEQAGKNIANLNNPNYARQRVLTGSIGVISTPTGPQSGPIVTIGITQARDQFLDKQILNEVSFTASLETQDFRLRQILSSLGESLNRISDPQFLNDVQFDSGGLRGSVDTFFNAFEAFSSRPNDPTTRQVLLQAAQNLVDSFNRIDGRLERIEQNLESEIQDEVSRLNQRLVELNSLNREIARLEVGGAGAANDLRDARQAKLEEISAFILIDAIEPPGGQGQIVVRVRDENGDPVEIIQQDGTFTPLFFDAANGTVRVEGSANDLDLQVGRLPAIIAVKDQFLADMRMQIDTLANTLATEVNEIYYQAFDGLAVPPVPEIAFFAQPVPPPSVSGIPGAVTAASIRLYDAPSDPLTVTDFVPLSVSTLRASDTGFSGANNLALAISNLSSQEQSSLGNVRFNDFATRIIITLGQDILDVTNRLDVQRTVENTLRDRRSEISGVSLDEELTQMVQFQKAFQASSRVFNVLSEMLDTIVNGLR